MLAGVLLLCAAFIWWTVNGITAMDTPDGEPSGPLHGYGVLAVLVVGGLATLLLGVRRLRQDRAPSE